MSVALNQGLLTGDTLSKLKHNFNTPNTKIQERELSINQNQILQIQNQFMRKENWESIKNQLASNDVINTLVLSGISINAEGIKILSDIIRTYPQIKNLKLEWNILYDFPNEFDQFCNAVTTSCIVYLSLNNNKINSGMCSSIQYMIANAKNLLYLDMRWNEIGNDGAKLIIAALTKNQNIIELNLIGNKINGDTLRQIAEFMAKNKEFQNDYVFRGKVEQPKNKNQQIYNDIEQIIPLKVIEREKALSNEFKARYDVQLVQNAKLEKENRELSKNLEIERGKVLEMKKNYDDSLEIETTNRIKAEEVIVQLQEKISKLTIENNQLQSNYDDFVKKSTIEKDNLNLQLKSLQDTIARKEKNFEEKYNLLKNENEKINKSLNSTIAQISRDNEDKNKDFLEQSKKLITSFEKRIKEYEGIIEKLKKEKNQLQNELDDEKKNALDDKYALEEKYKNREAKIYNEEQTKFSLMKQELEHTIEKLQSENENLTQQIKNYQTNNKNNVPSDSDHIGLYSIDMDKFNEISVDNAKLSSKNSSLESEISSMLIKMKAKDNEIKKLNEQIAQFDIYKDKLDQKSTEYAFKKDREVNREKELFQNEKLKLNEKIKELENENSKLKESMIKIENNIPKVKEQIKSTLLSYIDSN